MNTDSTTIILYTIYTDGSKSSYKVSYAIFFPYDVFSFCLLSSCSIFTAEFTAVVHVLKKFSKALKDNSFSIQTP